MPEEEKAKKPLPGLTASRRPPAKLSAKAELMALLKILTEAKFSEAVGAGNRRKSTENVALSGVFGPISGRKTSVAPGFHGGDMFEGSCKWAGRSSTSACLGAAARCGVAYAFEAS